MPLVQLHVKLTPICILILTCRCNRTGSTSCAVSRGAILARTSLTSSVRCAPLAPNQWRESALPHHDTNGACATDLSPTIPHIRVLCDGFWPSVSVEYVLNCKFSNAGVPSIVAGVL